MLNSRRRREEQEAVTSQTENVASDSKALPLPSNEKTGEIVRGFEKSPDTLGIPDKEDWIHRTDDLNSSASEASRGSIKVK